MRFTWLQEGENSPVRHPKDSGTPCIHKSPQRTSSTRRCQGCSIAADGTAVPGGFGDHYSLLQVLHSQGCQEQGRRSAAVTRVCIRINLGKSSSPLPRTCLKLSKKRTCPRDKGQALPLPVFHCGGSSPLFYFVPTGGDADLSHDGSSSQSALSPLPTISSSFGFANFRWQEPAARSTFTFRPQTPAQIPAPP